MMGRELLAKLRRDAQHKQLWRDGHVAKPVDMEEAEAEQREHERLLDYRLALHAERQGVAQHLRQAEGIAPDEKVGVSFTPPHRWPSAAALAADLRARLRAIDEELSRVKEQ